MILETWLYVKPAAWAAAAPVAEPATKEIWHYPYKNAKTGFWNPYLTDYAVYNVIGLQTAIQALIDELDPLGIVDAFAWIQGPGFDSLDQWPTDPTKILAVMKDHVTYDEDGIPTGSIPATQANPNWGHVFLGQYTRIFAGDFNNDFNQDFR